MPTRLPWPEAEVVGGWWNRQFSPEVDLVGADRAPVARKVSFTGSVKWLGTPFDDHDLATLARDSALVPGVEPGSTGLVVVSRTGATARGPVELVWSAEHLLAAWQG